MDRRLLAESRLQLVQPIMSGMPRPSALVAALATFCLATAAHAAPTPRPVVVELFTSQACSDCPPADALLQQLQASDPRILALDLHVTYFNGPGWNDPFSSKATTDRQYWYASLHRSNEVYTPQAVIDGQAVAVGSHRDAIVSSIEAARRAAVQPEVAVAITSDGAGWRISLKGEAPKMPANVTLFRFDEIDRTAVRGGENAGANLTEIHVVRAILPLGEWNGQPLAWQLEAGGVAHIAVLVQQNDGAILGAGSS